MLDKATLIQYCEDTLKVKLEALNGDMLKLKESSSNETKSAMGDKYETGAELIKQEQDKVASVLAEVNTQLSLLNKIDSNKSQDQIGFGSLIETSNGYFFIAIPLGLQKVEGKNVAFVTVQSPIAQAMIGKTSKDEISFQSRKLKINSIC